MSWLWRSRCRHISCGYSGIRHRCGVGGPWQGSLFDPTEGEGSPILAAWSVTSGVSGGSDLPRPSSAELRNPKMAMETSQRSMRALDEGAAAWRPAEVDEDLTLADPKQAGVADVVGEASAALEALQHPDGHWVFELEADATIPSEYILLEHFLGEIDQSLEDKIGVYLRAGQADHGGWPLYTGGDFDLSATVKAYYALKLIGDDRHAPHMARARAAILAHGGAARCNVFTRITLALFGQVPWRAVPVMPVEIMLLPRWFPFHLDKVSYWSRTAIVPLLILMACKPRARNPRAIGIEELFVTPPERERRYIANPTGSAGGRVFLAIDRILRLAEPFFPRRTRQRAIRQAVAFITEHLNGEDGLGAIFPPMAASVMVFDTLGYPKDHPDLVIAKRAVRKLLADNGDFAYFQPCLSPFWDTALACHALMEAGLTGAAPNIRRALDWIAERQILETVGDWAKTRPGLRPGGWPFQYRNDYYPDVDDSAVILCALHRADPGRYRHAIERGVEWMLGLQSRNGGWGSFDADNTHEYLNNIPFADHGALLDPPTADLTARCISALAQLGYGREHPAIARGARVSPRRAGGGRLMVRPLGDQLHLRHLVGAKRAERRRGGPGAALCAKGGRLAEVAPAGGWRLGRELRQLLG